jgi:hypothetical protein
MGIGGTGTDAGYSVATDTNGNILVAGYFNGTVDFGGGSVTSEGSADIFVAKYSPNGAYLWAKRFGGSGDDQARSLAVDRNGDLVVTGYFSDTTTFGASTYTSVGRKDIFLCKLSGSSGAVIWSKQFGAGFEDLGWAVAVDPNNSDVVITGSFTDYADFGGGWLFSANATAPDSFLARYSSAWNYLWGKRFGPGSIDEGRAVAVDNNGNVFLAGGSGGTIDLGGDIQGTAGQGLAYVAKYDLAGTYIWSEVFGNEWGGTFYCMAVDANGDVALAGQFEGNVDFGSGSQNYGAYPYHNTPVVKLSGLDGHCVWTKRILATVNSTTGNSSGAGVAMDRSGNVIVMGYFQNSCDFSGGSLTSNGGYDGFVAKYSASGSYIWAERLGGSGSDWGNGVAVDGNGSVVVTGTTMGGNFGGVTLPSAGGYDVFLKKLAP